VVFGITSFAGFGASAFSSCFGVFSRGFIAGFTSLCEGAATDGFLTGSATFSGFGVAFFGSAAAVFFTGLAFSGAFLFGVFATGFEDLTGILAGAALLGADFFTAGAAVFLTFVLELFLAAGPLAGTFGAALPGFAPLATVFFGAAFFVAIHLPLF
jgi:hypothetical protein